MTIICALAAPEGVWLGTDRRVNFSGLYRDTGVKHIVHNGAALLVAGAMRAHSVLHMLREEVLAEPDPYAIACNIKEALSADGWKLEPEEPGVPPGSANDIVLALTESFDGARVWSVGSDATVLPFQDGCLAAFGSGMHAALGADHVSVKAAPETRIRRALSAACAIADGCGGKPWVHLLQ